MRRLLRSIQARADLKSILAYLNEHSESAADRFTRDLAARLRLALSQPRIGRDRSLLSPGLRSFVVGRYIVLYTFTDTDLEVARILHGSRDIEAGFHASE